MDRRSTFFGNSSGIYLTMMRMVGRSLQHIGLIALPVSILMELTGMMGRAFGLSQMLLMMVFGMCSFYLGRYLEGYAIGSTTRS